jgi:hypothetical protein
VAAMAAVAAIPQRNAGRSRCNHCRKCMG